MKSAARTLSVLFFFSILFAHVPVMAAELEPSSTPLRKLQRGFLNVALSPLEVLHALSENKRADRVIPTYVTGLGRGSAFMVGRALSGVYEMITFPFPLPSGYEPVVHPEFAWEHFEGYGEEQR